MVQDRFLEDDGANMTAPSMRCAFPLAPHSEYTATMPAEVPPILLSLLACPACKRQDLAATPSQGQPEWLVCHHCHLGYPMVDGIPVLLTGRAISVLSPA
jgi:uncharacterized protein YbaR (Trm112 family)